MFRFLSKLILLKLLRWKIVGTLPNLSHFIAAVAPHNSFRDFFLGVMMRSILKEEINFVAKKELFTFFTAWFFRWQGGFPVDRRKKGDTVQSIVKLFQSKLKFRLAIAPEGTRKKVDKWKTGFYYIAKEAQIPIVFIAFDYGRKEIVIHSPFYPTLDMEKDFDYFYSLFSGVKGYGEN